MADKTFTPKTQWADHATPAFATHVGSNVPAMTVFMAPTRLQTFDESTEDDIEFTYQFPHDLERDAATIVLHPQVHWTAVASPAADALLYWQLCYTVAKESHTLAGAATFPAVSTLTSDVRTLTGGEYRKHLVTNLPDITIAVADLGPSMMMVGNFRIGADSTVAAAKVGLLSINIHALSRASGLAEEDGSTP